MKSLFVPALLLLGGSCAAQAQLAAPSAANDERNVAPDFAATSAVMAQLVRPHSDANLGGLVSSNVSYSGVPARTAPLALPAEGPEPPAPSPQPKFVYGGRDDYRWQLGLGFDLFRFQTPAFNATAFGIKSSVSYFLNEWLAAEGNLSTAFASTIYQNEHVKTFLYGGGPKIAWRQRNWEPWLHAIFGGAHEQPRTSKGGGNAFGIQAGGGADYRVNPRFSARLGIDYVHTSFFGKSQNNYEGSAGIVVHF
jgi:opacity protein-like surface antigen